MKTEPFSDSNGCDSNDGFLSDFICPQCSVFFGSEQQLVNHLQYSAWHNWVATEMARRMVIDFIRSYCELYNPQKPASPPSPFPPNHYEGMIAPQMPFLNTNEQLDIAPNLFKLVPVPAAAAGDGYQDYHPNMMQVTPPPPEQQHHARAPPPRPRPSAVTTMDLVSLLDGPIAHTAAQGSIPEGQSVGPEVGDGHGALAAPAPAPALAGIAVGAPALALALPTAAFSAATGLALAPPAPAPAAVSIKREEEEPMELDLDLDLDLKL